MAFTTARQWLIARDGAAREIRVAEHRDSALYYTTINGRASGRVMPGESVVAISSSEVHIVNVDVLGNLVANDFAARLIKSGFCCPMKGGGWFHYPPSEITWIRWPASGELRLYP